MRHNPKRSISVFLLVFVVMLGLVPSAQASETDEYPMEQPTAIVEEMVDFAFPMNGFTFGAGIQFTLDNLMKLYEPGDGITFAITAPEGQTALMDGYSISIQVFDAYELEQPGIEAKLLWVRHNDVLVQSILYDSDAFRDGKADSLSIWQNGLYQLEVVLEGNGTLQKGVVNIGVMPKNTPAEDSFIWGIHTTMERCYTWIPNNRKEYGVVGIGANDERYGHYGFDLLWDYVAYSGVNLIRDGAGLDFEGIHEGNTYTVGAYNSNQQRAMEAIFAKITASGIRLDWPTYGVPLYSLDGDMQLAFGEKPGLYPPTDAYMDIFMRRVAELADTNGVGADQILYEIWNEPNALEFYRIDDEETILDAGKYMERYLKTLDSATTALLESNDSRRITNGGMVVNPKASGDKIPGMEYYEHYIKAVREGRLSYISIHPHGLLRDCHKFYEDHLEEILVERDESTDEILADYTGYLFLNETGYSTEDVFGQAYHTAGKAIWAKGNNCAGFIAFRMGAVSHDNYASGGAVSVREQLYEMITQDLQPKPVFLAYMTAIDMLDGLDCIDKVEGFNQNTSDENFRYIFTDGNTPFNEEKPITIEVNVGTVPPGDSALGDTYIQYDMMGRMGGGTQGISYRVYGEEGVTITYDANGGSHDEAVVEMARKGDDYSVSPYGFTLENHTLTGWNTEPDGSGESYDSNTEFEIEDSMTLYAQWKVNAPDPGPNPGGGDGGSSSEGSSGGSGGSSSDASQPGGESHGTGGGNSTTSVVAGGNTSSPSSARSAASDSGSSQPSVPGRPNTGDTAQVWILGIVSIMAGLLLVILLIKRMKLKK